MYIVVCPQCNTENIGSFLECIKCNSSLVGLTRKKSSEAPPVEIKHESYVYDLYIDENKSAEFIIPQTHCSSCYADQPNHITKPLTAESQVNEYSGTGGKAHKQSINLQFPLCNLCFYDYEVLHSYQSKNYDPTRREKPALKRFSQVMGYLLWVSVGAFFLIHFLVTPKEWISIACLPPIIVSIVWIISLVLSEESFDKELRKGLEADAKNRLREVRLEGRKGDYPGTGFLKIKANLQAKPRYHYEVQFENEQYRDLLVEVNKLR